MFEEYNSLHTKKSYLMNKYKFICEENRKNRELLDEKKKELDIMNKSSIVTQAAIKDTLNFLETNITEIANKALACVFKDSYVLSFVVSTRGKSTKNTTIRIELKKDGVCLSKNLTESCEGGVLAILSVVLRIAFILLKEETRRVVLLDEILAPISRISDGDSSNNSNLTRAVEMIEILSDMFKIQTIIVSHCLDK